MQDYSQLLSGLLGQQPPQGRDMTQENLAAAVDAMQRQRNIGQQQPLPQAGGGTDYAAMLQALQGAQGGGMAPGYPGLQGMRFDPGAGFLPNVAPPQMQQPQQALPALPPMTHGAPPPIQSPNLGLGGGIPWRNIGHIQQR